MTTNRRLLLKSALAGASAPLLNACTKIASEKQEAAASPDKDWLKAGVIESQIVVPSFADKTFNIVDYGAVSGEGQNCAESIHKAIEDCNKQGGGRVVVPKGTFYTGPIHLLSNVNLHIEEGSVLKFIPKPELYLPAVVTRWEGMELMGYSPLIYAYKQKNIAITGKGTLDGSADNDTWWPWKGEHKEKHWNLIPGEDQKFARKKLMKDLEAGTPVEKRVYADKAYLRPPFVQPYECENVLIEGLTVKDSPFWLLNPVLCNSVTVRDMNLDSHGPNSDGCNPESCNLVMIERCNFNTGDDCIAIKSGRNADGRRINIASQNIIIRNCSMQDGHGGVVLGSELSGGINNVFVENCKMNSPLLERAIRIKTNSVRGGVVEHLRVRNVEVGDVQEGVTINFFYEEGDAGKFDPTVRDVVIENLSCKNVLKRAFNLQGFDRMPMRDITVINSRFEKTAEKSIVSNVKNFNLSQVSINGEEVSAEQLMKAIS